MIKTHHKRYTGYFAVIAILCLAVSYAIQAHPQALDDKDDDGAFIQNAFTGMKLKPPELAWVLPSGELVTEFSAKELTIFSAKISPVAASNAGEIPAESVKAYVMKNKVDCHQAAETEPSPLYRYTATMPSSKQAEQVLVLERHTQSQITGGFTDVKLNAKQTDPVWLAMDARSGRKRLIYTAKQPGRLFSYSFAMLFTNKGNLMREGTFLQDQTGKILGKEIDDVDEDHLCDGCGLPTYEWEVARGNPALNLITIPTLPYPMVLMDSSTVEGRAIELFTFSATGQSSHYRKYEYMVTCILGSKE